MLKKWYIIKVVSGSEDKVKNHIFKMIKLEKLESFLGEILIPVEKIIETKEKKISKKELAKDSHGEPKQKTYYVLGEDGKRKRTLKFTPNGEPEYIYNLVRDKDGHIIYRTEREKIETTKKLYPGYIFLELEINDEVWHFINNIPGVSNFVGGKKGKPSPIPEKDMTNILKNIENNDKTPRQKVSFAVGEVVRILEGPFVEFSGIVKNVNYEKLRLDVEVSIFGRSTPVELEFSQVAKS